jgi:hypothetical protein
MLGTRMAEVRSGELPAGALTHRHRLAGAYTDCYFIDLPRPVTLAEFVAPFYTSWLFRLERWLLRILVARPSTDEEAHELARGGRNGFAAWSVKARAPAQLLMRDFTGRTSSWFMVTPAEGSPGTRLHFGSVVVPVRNRKTGAAGLGSVHGSLMGFHRLYSRLLLRAAARRL